MVWVPIGVILGLVPIWVILGLYGDNGKIGKRLYWNLGIEGCIGFRVRGLGLRA